MNRPRKATAIQNNLYKQKEMNSLVTFKKIMLLGQLIIKFRKNQKL